MCQSALVYLVDVRVEIVSVSLWRFYRDLLAGQMMIIRNECLVVVVIKKFVK